MQKSHKNLIVWQKSIDLVSDIYRLTSSFPKEEIFGITSQMRRCVVSIPCNIAEGVARGTTTEYVRFLRIALSSAAELDTQLIICQRLGYVTTQYIEINDNLNEIIRMTMGLIGSLSSKKIEPNP